MLRIIAGSAKGVRLLTPQGLSTRPTADRTREALFNILQMRISDARFLDLFCGSGAVGLEAISRGAKSVVFVEKSHIALDALSANLTRTKLNGSIIPHCVSRAEKSFLQDGSKFDIIFADPPYNLDIDKILTHVPQILAENGIFVLESDSKVVVSDFGLTPVMHRSYGRTKLTFFEHNF